MDHGFLINLPTEIIINILSRLPYLTILSCKCVCKSWFELIEAPEFIKLHLSKSVPGLIVYQQELQPDIFRILELEDELETGRHELHYVPLMVFDREAFITTQDYALTNMEGSTNGLLLLRDRRTKPQGLYICNPITREYINLPNSEESFYYPSVVTYGFGVSKKTDQYKVVRIFHDYVRDPITGSLLSITKSECRVYTLGTGTWRSLPHYKSSYDCRRNGTFFNGNLHWLVSELKGSLLILCFDLEKEVFRVFDPPPYLKGRRDCVGDIGVLRDCLCLCDNTSENETVIWVMKEYGIEKSWTKDIVISKLPDLAGESYEVVYPLKVFNDGDILLLWVDFICCYSQKTQTISNVGIFGSERCPVQARLHVSSFLSLKSFAMENVDKF